MQRLLRVVTLTAVIFGFGAGTASAEQERYVFDKAHTQILFFVSHLGFSMMQGEFHDYDGEFIFDREDPSRSLVEVSIATASVDTDHDGLNEHLRTADFFDSETHPTMSFKSTSIERTGEDTGLITGDFTMLGVTRPVTLDVTFNKADVHPVSEKYIAGFSGSTTIKRSDYGMTYSVPAVGDEVKVRLEVEGIRQ
jgi:polyisoprenoid-binding protein YceI